ncbi:uncharacterized protein LOC144435830 [Glandiceps talaboti]
MMKRFSTLLIICIIWCSNIKESRSSKSEKDGNEKASDLMLHVYQRQSPNTCNSGLCQGICRTNSRDCRADEMVAPSGCTCDSSFQCCISDPTAKGCAADCNGVCRLNFCLALEMQAPKGCKCGGNSVCCINDPTAIPCSECNGMCRETCNFGEMVAPGACTCGQDRTCCIPDPTVQRCNADCGGRCRTQCLLGERLSTGPCYCMANGEEPSFCCVDDPDVQVCGQECDGICRYNRCRQDELDAPTNCDCLQGSGGNRVCCQEPDGVPLPTEGPTEDGTGSGDPHMMTFDESKYSFQGNCSYVLVQDSVSDIPQFVVEIKNEIGTLKDKIVSRIHAVTIRVGDHEIEMDQHKVLIVDNGLVTLSTLPCILTDSESPVTTISHEQGVIHATIMPDLSVVWDGKKNVLVHIHESLAGRVTGLLGNADGDSTNDMVDRNGATVDIDTFLESWKVDENC